MNNPFLIGKFCLLINHETHEPIGKAQIVEYLHDKFYWAKMFDDEDGLTYHTVMDLENIAGIPFFNTLKELEHFSAMMPHQCPDCAGKEVSH